MFWSIEVSFFNKVLCENKKKRQKFVSFAPSFTQCSAVLLVSSHDTVCTNATTCVAYKYPDKNIQTANTLFVYNGAQVWETAAVISSAFWTFSWKSGEKKPWKTALIGPAALTFSNLMAGGLFKAFACSRQVGQGKQKRKRRTLNISFITHWQKYRVSASFLALLWFS